VNNLPLEMKSSYRLTPAAEAEIIEALLHSEAEFGRDARDRYEVLIFTAIADLAANPDRPGSRLRPELGRGIRSWHLRLSRERARTDTGIVKEPRHFIFYRLKEGVVVIVRVLGDRQDAQRHFAKWRRREAGVTAY